MRPLHHLLAVSAVILAGCSPARSPLESLTIPDVPHSCPRVAVDPKPLPTPHTLDQLKQWAAATAQARDSDKRALRECGRALAEAVGALQTIQMQINDAEAGHAN
jgi:hypothetical protein